MGGLAHLSEVGEASRAGRWGWVGVGGFRGGRVGWGWRWVVGWVWGGGFGWGWGRGGGRMGGSCGGWGCRLLSYPGGWDFNFGEVVVCQDFGEIFIKEAEILACFYMGYLNAARHPGTGRWIDERMWSLEGLGWGGEGLGGGGCWGGKEWGF